MENILDPRNKHREKYLIFKSNIKKYLSVDNVNDLFNDLLLIAKKEEEVIKKRSWISNIDDYSFKQCIYVAMHIGMYRTIVASIISKGINVCIPVTEYVYNNNRIDYMSFFQEMDVKGKGKIDVINIESRSGLAQLIKNVKNGFSVLLYLDGNSGFGGMKRDDEKLIGIYFLNKKIYVRKGAYKLSILLKLPICPVISYSNDSQSIIEFKNNIDINLDVQSEQKVMQYLWGIFENYVILYKGQWEAWAYANVYLREEIVHENKKKSDFLIFNSEKFDFLIDASDYYIFNLYDNNKRKISKTLYLFFEKLFFEKIILSREDLTSILKRKDLISDILEEKILY